jgi:hypothetical protein
METKCCNQCGESLPLNAFYKEPYGGGPRSICKMCFKRNCSEREHRHREVTVVEKCCRKCGQVKPASAFKHRNGCADGLVGECKDCRDKHERADYALNPHKQKGRNEKWRQAHPDKAEAANIASQKRRREALKRAGKNALSLSEIGHIVAQGCRFCGANEGIGLAHDLAVSKGGLTTKDNCFCLCKKYNAQMGTLNYSEALAGGRFK